MKPYVFRKSTMLFCFSFLMALLFFFDSQDGLKINRSIPFLKYAKSNKYFSMDYCESRDRFRKTSSQFLESYIGELIVKNIKIQKENIHNLELVEPCGKEEIDREGNDIVSIDALSVPASREKKHLLVMVSGLHGVEAPLGAASQQLLLQEYLLKNKFNMESTGVLLIHALNPYGFKYFRRFNQFNVDLNRNSFSQSGVSSFFARSEKINVKYDQYYSAFNPIGKVPYLFSAYGSFFDRWKRVLFDFLPMLWQGENVAQIFAGGQYRHQQGIYFGGHQRQEEIVFFEETFRRVSEGYKNVFFVDVHSGVGKGNTLNVLPWAKSEEKRKALQKVFLNDEGELLRSNTYTLDFGSEEIGYETHGDIVKMVSALTKKDQESISLTAEYGTHTLREEGGVWSRLKTALNGELGSIRTLYWMCREHQGYHYGYENKEAQRVVTEEFIHRFIPYRSTRWVGTGAKVWQNSSMEQMRFLIGEIFLKRIMREAPVQ